MILFDLDGTIVDTTDLILASFACAFDRHLPGRLPSREALIHTFGRSLPAVLRELAIACECPNPETLAAQMLDTYRDFQTLHHDTLIKPFPGVADMLHAFGTRGRRLGIVTSKREGFARRGLRLFGLEALFEIAIFHDDTGFLPNDVIYVGDSVHDIIAGRAAGMRTVAVLWGPFERAVLERERPDHIVNTPEQLVQLLAPTHQ
jgi:pyrophosphatase PpaX